MDLLDLMATLTLDASDFENGIQKAGEMVHSLGNTMDTALSSLGRLPEGAEVMGQLTVDSLRSMGEEIGSTAGAWRDIWLETWQGAIPAVEDLLEQLSAAATERFNALGEAITSAVEAARAAVTEGFSAIAERIQGSTEEGRAAAEGSFSAILALVSENTEGARSAVEGGFSSILSLVTEHTEGARSAAGGAFSAILALISENTEGARGAVEGGFSSILSLVTAHTEGARAAVSEGFSTILRNITDRTREAGAAVSEQFGNIRSRIEAVMDSVSGTVDSVTSAIHGFFRTRFGEAYGTVSGIFDNIHRAISDKITAAKDTVAGVIDQMKALFNFSWSLPHLALPHLSVSGRFSLDPPSVPSFSISWYRKAMQNAMLLDSPTIFGMSGNTLLGAGEAGQEVVAGADTLMGMIRSATNYGNEEIVSILRRILETLDRGGGTITLHLDGQRIAEAAFDPMVRYAKSLGTPMI